MYVFTNRSPFTRRGPRTNVDVGRFGIDDVRVERVLWNMVGVYFPVEREGFETHKTLATTSELYIVNPDSKVRQK